MIGLKSVTEIFYKNRFSGKSVQGSKYLFSMMLYNYITILQKSNLLTIYNFATPISFVHIIRSYSMDKLSECRQNQK